MSADLVMQLGDLRLQENTWVEEGADPRKYAVGAKLVFTGYDRKEVEVVPHTGLEYGDELVVRPKNGCEMGIDVDRVRDGLIDMVWPTEVELCKGVDGGE